MARRRHTPAWERAFREGRRLHGLSDRDAVEYADRYVGLEPLPVPPSTPPTPPPADVGECERCGARFECPGAADDLCPACAEREDAPPSAPPDAQPQDTGQAVALWLLTTWPWGGRPTRGPAPAMDTTRDLVRWATGDGPWREALGRAAELRAAADGALCEATVRPDVDWPAYQRAKEAACDAEAMWRFVQTRDAVEVGRLVFIRRLVETGRLHEGREEG